MRAVSQDQILALLKKAKNSPRKRTHFRLHKYQDPVQRMINAMVPGTYIPPHKHENPSKIELFSILIGKVACIKLTSRGKTAKIHLLDENGPVKIVDIRPGIYHTFVALAPSAMLEIIQGPYNPKTHKNWPAWAPPENSPAAKPYLKKLESQVNEFLNRNS